MAGAFQNILGLGQLIPRAMNHQQELVGLDGFFIIDNAVLRNAKAVKPCANRRLSFSGVRGTTDYPFHPSSPFTRRKVAFKPKPRRTKPRQFGPMIRIPYFFLIRSISLSDRVPSAPISLNPAEIMTTPSTPAWPHSSTTPGTDRAGVATTARST